MQKHFIRDFFFFRQCSLYYFRYIFIQNRPIIQEPIMVDSNRNLHNLHYEEQIRFTIYLLN